MKTIEAIKPKVKTPEQTKLETDRKLWESKYSQYLLRKNKLAEKLLAKGRPLDSSERYQELSKLVKKYWQLLHDSKPAYKPL